MTGVNLPGFNGHTRAGVLSANWPVLQILDNDGVEFDDVGIRGRNLLTGIGFLHDNRASVSIDLLLNGCYHWLHVNIHNSTHTQIPRKTKRDPGGAGDKTKGTVYCEMQKFSGGNAAPPPFANIVIGQCNKEIMEGKVENRTSCIHQDLGIILQDVGKILGVFLHGFLTNDVNL